MGKKRQTRREQVQEAEKIYEWLIFQRELAGDLNSHQRENCRGQRRRAADARLDLAHDCQRAGRSQPSRDPGMRYGRIISTTLLATEIVRDSLRNFKVSHGVSLPHALSAFGNREGSLPMISMNLSVGTSRCCPEVSHRTFCELRFCTLAYLRIFCLGSLFKHQIFWPRNPRIVEQC